MVYGLWLMSVTRFMVYKLLWFEDGVWFKLDLCFKSGLRFIVYVLWFMSTWFMVYGGSKMVYGSNIIYALWFMMVQRWCMVYGLWFVSIWLNLPRVRRVVLQLND